MQRRSHIQTDFNFKPQHPPILDASYSDKQLDYTVIDCMYKGHQHVGQIDYIGDVLLVDKSEIEETPKYLEQSLYPFLGHYD